MRLLMNFFTLTLLIAGQLTGGEQFYVNLANYGIGDCL